MSDTQSVDQSNLIYLKKIAELSKSFDEILDKPADQWTQKQINFYHLLQGSLDKYKVRYSLAQFKLDVRDIKKNIKSCPWFINSTYKKVLNWCLDQLIIKSYQQSKQSGDFRLVARFNQALIRLEIHKKGGGEEGRNGSGSGFEYLVHHETKHISTNNLHELDTMTQIFGIDPNISPEHRTQVINEIASMIKEIGLFYN